MSDHPFENYRRPAPGLYRQVAVAALPSGGGGYTRVLTIGDGHPAILIELILGEDGGDPSIDLKVTTGGLGFSDYRGAIGAIGEALSAALLGLASTNIDVSSKHLLPGEDPHA